MGGRLLPYEGVMPEVAEGVFLAPGSWVIGKVRLEQGVSIWYNAVVRGDLEHITIGENTNIQDNCTVHIGTGKPTCIGSFVSVGHGSIIHACTVEDYCLIGMNAAIMDGAHVGEGCIIGAGAVVSPDSVIPPYSIVVGVPGKVIKSVDPATTKEARRQQTQRYLNAAKNHQKMLQGQEDTGIEIHGE